MKLKFRLAIALALLTTLAGCVSTGAAPPAIGTPIVIPTAQLPARARQVQAAVLAACRFQLVERSATALIRAARPAYGDTTATLDWWVREVCAAANGGQYASLNGVPIRGRFVGR